MITIKVNGKEENITEEMKLTSFLQSKNLNTTKVIIEYNANILPMKEWDSLILKDNDQLEILSLVTGG